MANENDVEQLEDVEDLPEIPEGEEDTTDYKALAAKNAGIAKRYKTKLEKEKLAKKVEKGVEKVLEKNKDEFGDAQLAYLAARGIIEDDEIEFAQHELKNSGKSLKELLGNKYFQAELKDLRDGKETAKATPNGTKRSGQSAQNTIEYWVAKGGLPDDRKLAQEVVKARRQQASDNRTFTENSVV